MVQGRRRDRTNGGRSVAHLQLGRRTRIRLCYRDTAQQSRGQWIVWVGPLRSEYAGPASCGVRGWRVQKQKASHILAGESTRDAEKKRGQKETTRQEEERRARGRAWRMMMMNTKVPRERLRSGARRAMCGMREPHHNRATKRARDREDPVAMGTGSRALSLFFCA